jgi:hypothetical protein
MLGDVLLRRPERLLQLGDRRRPATQVVEQPDAHGLADHPEALWDQLDERLWEKAVDVHSA